MHWQKRTFIITLGCMLLYTMPVEAHAAMDNWRELLCAIIKAFIGPMGMAISTVAVIFVAIPTMKGKMEWTYALLICVTICGMFISAKLVLAIGDAAGLQENAICGFS